MSGAPSSLEPPAARPTLAELAPLLRLLPGSLHRNGDAQEGCGNGCRVVGCTLVVADEQGIELLRQLVLFAVLFCRFECVHRGPVVIAELGSEGRRSAGRVEGVRISNERDLLLRNS